MRMLTISEVKAETGIPPDTIYSHIKQGALSVIKVGGSEAHTGLYLVSQDSCERYKKWLNENYKAKNVKKI